MEKQLELTVFIAIGVAMASLMVSSSTPIELVLLTLKI